MKSKAERFHPGTTIPSSGIYSAVHTGHPKDDHDVTCLRGRKFPECRECGSSVEFVLVRKAKHVKYHELFAVDVASAASLAP